MQETEAVGWRWALFKGRARHLRTETVDWRWAQFKGRARHLRTENVDWRWALFKDRATHLRKAVKSAFDTSRHECAVCGFQGPFSPTSTPTLPNSKCPSCGCSSRHRLIALAVAEIGLLAEANQGDVLHFAAERCLRPLIMRAGPIKYMRADIDPRRGDIVLDIEALDLPQESYDLIICSHVLEHIDDRKALHELFRVLRHRGKLIAMVPIIEGWKATYENDSIRTWEARKLHFGGGTHIRYYGQDFRDRLNSVGFSVSEFCATPEQVVRYSLIRGERIFICTKP
jgi:Methyltransferase domain